MRYNADRWQSPNCHLATSGWVGIRRSLPILVLLLCLLITPALAKPEAPLVELKGTDFKGGAAELYGSIMGGEYDINYVYAKPTGGRSTMTTAFDLKQVPSTPLFVHLKGRDDDGPRPCAISITLNDKTIFEGQNDFSQTEWLTRKFSIPAGTLREGQNTITIANTEPEGRVGMYPWFQVSRCYVAGDSFKIVRDITRDFWVTLPKDVRPFPESLKPGEKPGFEFRGTKGWMWRPEQYLAEIPVMAKYKMNFLMNCYGSMCDIEHYGWGNAEINRWWEDLPDAKKKAYERIVSECRKAGVLFCFSMNPNLCSKRPLNYQSDEDVNQLWKHYSWMQGLGVKWFNISLDDISQGIDASGQAKVVNEIHRRLKANDRQANMIFTPTIYWGDGTPAHERPYLETLAKELDKDVYLFWTGNSVVGNITRAAADSYRSIAKHRLFLWDNYPVNDANPTMHLGPVCNRDADLCEVIDGYMSNPLCQQNEINRIPMLTCADYAYNPYAYDPLRSVGQAILHLEPSRDGRELLKDLVEIYPGFIILGRPSTGLNPVREQFSKLISLPHEHFFAKTYIRNLEDVAARMDKVFPNKYAPEKLTLTNDIKFTKQLLTNRYPD